MRLPEAVRNISLKEKKKISTTRLCYISLLKADASIVQSKKVPTIFTLKENAVGIEQGDYTEIDSNKYKVTGILDIQNYGIVVDISLEMEV